MKFKLAEGDRPSVPDMNSHENLCGWSRDTAERLQYSLCKVTLFVHQLQRNLSCLKGIGLVYQIWILMKICAVGAEIQPKDYFSYNMPVIME